jgi:hypothetical protein
MGLIGFQFGAVGLFDLDLHEALLFFFLSFFPERRGLRDTTIAPPSHRMQGATYNTFKIRAVSAIPRASGLADSEARDVKPPGRTT